MVATNEGILTVHGFKSRRTRSQSSLPGGACERDAWVSKN